MYASTLRAMSRCRSRRQRTVFISPYARQRTEKAFDAGHTSLVQKQDDKSPSLLPRIMTRAKTLASAAGCAALMAWMPLLLGAPRSTLPISPIEDAKPGVTIDAGTQALKEFAERAMKCAECGSIESIRVTQEDSEASEITVRLQDGSSRVMIDASPGTFRPGQRVKVIDGLAGPGA
jgi:hypothetical protein